MSDKEEKPVEPTQTEPSVIEEVKAEASSEEESSGSDEQVEQPSGSGDEQEKKSSKDKKADAKGESGEEEEELKVSRAANIIVTKTTDDMRAMVQVTPPVGNGSHVTVELLHKALNERKISFGINESKLLQIEKERPYGQTISIAEGEPAENGNDAQLIYHYNKLIERQDRSLDNLERVDWKELGNIINTDPDVLLLEKIPPTEGKPGTTVSNKRIRQTKGKDLRIRAGKGVRADTNNLKWYSEINGHVIFRNDQISVENIIEFEDVNTSTGNIHFKGTVLIKGIIEDGFSVDSTADIRIQGNVGAAKLTAKGDIAIVGGIFGKKQAVVRSEEGSIYTRFTQDATLVAGKNIVIDEYSRNSDLKARNAIRIINENSVRGCVMGGSVAALEEIRVNNLGNEMELFTRAIVGVSKEEMDRISFLEANLKKRLENLDNLRKSLFILLREKTRTLGKLDHRKSELYARFLKMLEKLQSNDRDDVIDLISLYQNQYTQKKSYLHINHSLYPNVEIDIKNASLNVKKTIEYATLTESDGEITILPLMGGGSDDSVEAN